MIFLSIIGFVFLCVLGVMFLFVGAACLWWETASSNGEWYWIIPIGIGALLLYVAGIFSPFTISLGVNT
jgi:hypothetical protein